MMSANTWSAECTIIITGKHEMLRTNIHRGPGAAVETGETTLSMLSSPAQPYKAMMLHPRTMSCMSSRLYSISTRFIYSQHHNLSMPTWPSSYLLCPWGAISVDARQPMIISRQVVNSDYRMIRCGWHSHRQVFKLSSQTS